MAFKLGPQKYATIRRYGGLRRGAAFVVSLIAVLLAGAASVPMTVSAREQIGELSVTDLMLEPTFVTQEPEGTGSHAFMPGRSYLAAGWKQDSVISARLMVGSRTLLVQPARYGLEDTSFGVIEAYAQADTAYGLVRMGYIPLPFGLEGHQPEYEQLFPVSLLYQTRAIGRRDLGASYAISHNSFDSSFAVHNGEGAEDRDRRLWYSARLAWKGPARSEIGISGMTGRHLDTVTLREEKIRAGNIFAGFNIYGLGLITEATMTTTHFEGNLVRQLLAYHIVALHPLMTNVGLQLRFDYLDPDHGMPDDARRDFTAGLRFGSQFKTSSLYVLGVKRLEEGNERINDQLLVIWRMSPWLVD
ncbi:MAG TPA: hypothetical protein VFV50_11975 [Bdellovibrionales bacterium]|nr:hypothetical protein [Bdellovibrionales bacterium]